MRLILYQWNGNAINDWTMGGGGNFSALYDIGARANLLNNPTFVPRTQNFPQLAGGILSDHYFVFNMVCRGANIATQRETIKSWFNVTDFQQHQLVFQDADNGNKQWYLQGLVKSVIEKKIGYLEITISLYDPIFRTVTQNSDTWNLTASGQTHNLTVAGNIKTKPIFNITMTAGRTSGYVYKRWVAVYNPTTVPVPFSVSTYDITQGGINTATLVSGGKMQSSCNDLRTFMDGAEVDNWIDSPNTTSTKVWINIPLSAGQSAPISVSIASSGTVPTISFPLPSKHYDPPSYAFLSGVQNAANKVVLIDSEAFTFTGVDLTNMQLTGVTRAQKGTAMAAHTSPVICYWIEHDIWMMYGNSAATAPVTNPANKPLIDFHNSTNAVIVQSTFYDNQYSRPFSWIPTVVNDVGGKDKFYTADASGGNAPLFANPATAMGMLACNFLSGNVYKANTFEMGWVFHHDIGFTFVACTGYKRISSTTLVWNSTLALQVLSPGSGGGKKHPTVVYSWGSLFTEAKPISTAWAAMTNTGNINLGGTLNDIRYALLGSISLSNTYAEVDFEILTISITLANPPVGTIGSEQSAAVFTSTLKNNISGEYIILTFPSQVNQQITIDCLNKQAYSADGVNFIGGLQFSTVRQDWLNFSPGTVTLELDDVGIGNTTIVTQWNDWSL